MFRRGSVAVVATPAAVAPAVAGTIGYLLKDAEPDDLARGIRSAARGESPLDPKAASAILALRERRRPGAELTDREREILALVADGCQTS